MTLREVGQGILSAVDTASFSVQHLSPLDWPLWLVALCIFCLLPFMIAGLQFFKAVTREVGEAIGGLADRVREAGERRQRRRIGCPDDPRERLRWANREGPYAGG